MSKIWSCILIISILIAIITSKPDIVINSVMENSKSSIENILVLAGMMCFWSGIFKVFENTSSIKKFSSFFSIFVNKIFDKKQLNKKSVEHISLNIASNVVGIGNASTLNGIKAMEELDDINHNSKIPNNNMTTFVLLNTASFQLIPTSIIALRSMYNSTNPTAIVVPVWIVTIVALMCGIFSIKLLNKRM